MNLENIDLQIQTTETFESWRTKYNILTERTAPINHVGAVSALSVPTQYRDSIVSAINYVYSIQSSTGQPVTQSAVTDCYVPTDSSFYFGGSSGVGTYFRTISTGVNYDIAVGNGSNLFAVFKSNGRLGVNTQTPESLFHCNGIAQVNEILLKNPVTEKTMSVRNATLAGNNYTIFNADSDIIFNNSATDMIVNTGGGKVGFGYTSKTGLSEAVNIRSNTSSVGLKFENANNSAQIKYTQYGMGFYDTNVLRMNLDPSGRLGINRLEPQYNLDVNGTAYANNLYFGTSLFAGSTEIVSSSGGQPVVGNIEAISANEADFNVVDVGYLTHNGVEIIDNNGFIPFSRLKTINLNTDQVSEGSSNRYFTNARAVSAVAAAPIPGITLSNVLNLSKHTTATRPTSPQEGAVVYDSTLKLPIFFDGTTWKNFSGVAV